MGLQEIEWDYMTYNGITRNGVLDEKLNLDETHLFWCSLFRKYQRNFFPRKKPPQTEKNEF